MIQTFKLIAFIFVFIFISSVFQNCGPQIDNNSMLSTKPGPVVLQGATLDAVPFAFETTINELAYMSCSNSPRQNADKPILDSSTFFTLSAQASGNNSGVALRTDFKNFMFTNFADSNSQVPENLVSTALSDSKANATAALMLAVRPNANPIDAVQNFNPQYTPQQSNDYSLFLSQNIVYSSLTFGQNLSQLAGLFNQPTTTKINNFIEPESDHLLSSAIHFHTYSNYYENSALDLRNKFDNGANFLTVTYTKDLRDPANQKTPYASRPSNTNPNNSTLAWGKAYRLRFSMNERTGGAGYSNTLYSVSELDLSNGITPTGAKWDCSKISYMIISPYDNDPAPAGSPVPIAVASSFPSEGGKPDFNRCQEPVAGTSLNAAQQAELSTMQRYLSSSDWIIDPINRCVVRKKNHADSSSGDCYPNRNPNGANRQIMYRDDRSGVGCGAINPASTKDCPEFISICTRVTN